MNFLWALLLLGVVFVGATGYVITSIGVPTRRKLKAKKVFFWLAIGPAAAIVLLMIWTRMGKHGR